MEFVILDYGNTQDTLIISLNGKYGQYIVFGLLLIWIHYIILIWSIPVFSIAT